MSETRTVTIVEFLEARLAEDEDEARIYLGAPAEYSELIGPARALREVEAKRAILRPFRELLDAWGDGSGLRNVLASHPEIALLASVYADHPDYDQAWAAS